MLGIALDVILLMVVFFFIERDAASEIGTLIGVALGMTAVNFICVLLLGPALGLLSLAPAIAVNALILMKFVGLSWGKACLTLGILYGVKVGFILLVLR